MDELSRTGGRQRSQRFIVVVAGERPDDLCPRPERGCTRSLPTTAPEDEDSSLHRVAGKAIRERGLTDPRLTDNEEQTTATFDGILQPDQELAELSIPANEASWQVGSSGSTRTGCSWRNQPVVAGGSPVGVLIT